MERVMAWAGVPPEGALERLSVICAHCNAKLTPAQMDYACREEALVPSLRAAFRPLRRDDATNEFLMRSSRRPHVVNWASSAACTYLRRSMSLTDANAILGRGKMHVLSEEQARDLLNPEATANEGGDGRRDGGDVAARRDEPSRPSPDARRPRVLLDVGAGEGAVTQNLRAGGGFDAVVATEASAPMVAALRRRSFDAVVESTRVEDAKSAARTAGIDLGPEDAFDAVALMNVLDRCDEPFTLLADLRKLVKPVTGRLVLAVVIPFRPFVERAEGNAPPRERLPLPSDGAWEAGVNALYERVLVPSGFEAERLARVPYICEGDQRHGAYILDDAVFVLRATDRTSEDPTAEGREGTEAARERENGRRARRAEPRDDVNAADAFG